MEAEWVEDQDVWLPQSLIVSCVGTVKSCGEDLQPWDAEKGYEGELFAGLDLAQVKDFCVLSVFERVNDAAFASSSEDFSAADKVCDGFRLPEDASGSLGRIPEDPR